MGTSGTGHDRCPSQFPNPLRHWGRHLTVTRWLMEPTMPLKKEFSDLRLSFEPLTLYQKFEQVCVLMLTTLIAIIIALAL